MKPKRSIFLAICEFLIPIQSHLNSCSRASIGNDKSAFNVDGVHLAAFTPIIKTYTFIQCPLTTQPAQTTAQSQELRGSNTPSLLYFRSQIE